MSSEIDYLSKMPNVVMDHILGKLDFLSILCLRKVCHSLRFFIDNYHHPNSSLYSIQITVGYGAINSVFRFSPDFDLSIIYSQAPNGYTSLEWRKRGRTRFQFLENSNFPDIFLKDFGVFWKNQRVKLEKLGVHFHDRNSSVFLEKFHTIVDQKVEIQEFDIKMWDFNDILRVLPFIRPQEITISNENREREIHLKMDEIQELEQWKNAKSFKCFRYLITVPVENLCHFRRCVVHFDTISFEDIEKMRKKFLHDSHLEFFSISSRNRVEFIPEYGEPFQIPFRERNMWFFKTEDPSQVLVIKLYILNIKFERIQISKVPTGARILG